MQNFSIQIDIDALKDIQDSIKWYNSQLDGLGLRFSKQVILQINSLKKNPHRFSVRYADIRCMLIKKFPFLVHFSIDDTKHIIQVYAIFHTSRNPTIWTKRLYKI